MNLQGLATRGRKLVEQAIATSGTTVTISRDPDDQDETVDPDTLDITDPTPPTPIAIGVNALVVSAGATTATIGPNRDERPPAFRVTLPVTVTDVQERDRLTVTASADQRLTGLQLRVTTVTDDPLGIARQLDAQLVD